MSSSARDEGALLTVRDITKQYGPTVALRGVSFELHPGYVYGLIGVNGSGKSTIMKIIAGAERASGGEMVFAGTSYRPRNVLGASRAGIGMVPQELPIVRRVSVVDNVLLGQWPSRLGTMLVRTARHLAATVLGRIGVEIDVRAHAGDLRLGEQQLTVIARTMARQPKLVLMDEPTSALAGAEVTRLRQVAREIANQGRTVMFVSQRLDDVFEICDHILVLRGGRLVESTTVEKLTPERAIGLMLRGAGPDTAVEEVPAPRAGRIPPELLSRPRSPALLATGLSIPGRLLATDIEIAAGEIVGLAGLPGSGHSEVLRALFGLLPCRADQLRLHGTPHRPSNPAAAIRAGFAYVTGDRQAEGLIPDASVATNIAMVLTRSARGGPRRLSRARREAFEQISALHIRPGDPDLAVRALSGGNQQKVVFARWSLTRPRLWLLDDATRGVDVGARHEIHEAVRASVHDLGAAAFVVSSDVLELFEVCDRVLVFRAGSLVADTSSAHTTPSHIEALATGTLEAVS